MNDIIQATTVQERVKTKVQELFVGLITDEEWSKLIKKEIDNFITPQTDNYNREARPLNQTYKKLIV